MRAALSARLFHFASSMPRNLKDKDTPAIREIRGQSSIMYVDPKDVASKPRKYTVFVDEPIELPR